MDNTNNNTGVNQPVTSAQPVVSVNQQAPTLPPTPVSLRQKEQAPIIPKDQGAELITPSEEEPKIPQEVKEAGVEQVADRLPLTDEDKAVGIEHAKESTPVQTQPSGMVKLPMGQKEALNTIKTTSNTDSRHWLAVLIEKIYKQLRFIQIK